MRPSPPSVTRGGSRKVTLTIIVIIVAILAALYFFLSRSPSTPAQQQSAGAPGAGGEQSPEATTTASSTDAGIAIGKARLQLESVGSKDTVRVVMDRPAGEGEGEVVYRFEWTLNGQPAGDGSDSLTGFKRGDRVAVKITPVIEGKTGNSRILDFLVQNTPPKIVEDQQAKLEGNVFSYQIKGIDQDGDVLSYALEDAPEGMTMDPQTGAIRWQLKESDYGEHTIKIKVSDGKGGVTHYSRKVDLQKASSAKTAGGASK